MSTSSQLTDQQRASILAGHRSFGRREMLRYWSLSERDFVFVNELRRQQNRLGFAVQLCLLRYPGCPLQPGELPPENLLQFVSAQLAVDPIEILEYGKRDRKLPAPLSITHKYPGSPGTHFGQIGCRHHAETKTTEAV
jgi:TnpA family transposase